MSIARIVYWRVTQFKDFLLQSIFGKKNQRLEVGNLVRFSTSKWSSGQEDLFRGLPKKTIGTSMVSIF